MYETSQEIKDSSYNQLLEMMRMAQEQGDDLDNALFQIVLQRLVDNTVDRTARAMRDQLAGW